MSARRRAQGFTLLEVLVALAVVALALAAGQRADDALTDNARRLEDVVAAQWCADNQLTELRLRRAFPGVGDSDFSCELLGRSFKGVLRTRPTPNPSFRRVDAVFDAALDLPTAEQAAFVERACADDADVRKEVLQLLKKERWPIRAYVEYEHRGTSGAVAEVRTCFDYAKRALA